jgi:hypothetical protein
MQLLSVLLAALAASEASAHYIFQRLDIGGTTGGVYEGIRQNNNYNSPVTGMATFADPLLASRTCADQVPQISPPPISDATLVPPATVARLLFATLALVTASPSTPTLYVDYVVPCFLAFTDISPGRLPPGPRLCLHLQGPQLCPELLWRRHLGQDC